MLCLICDTASAGNLHIRLLITLILLLNSIHFIGESNSYSTSTGNNDMKGCTKQRSI